MEIPAHGGAADSARGRRRPFGADSVLVGRSPWTARDAPVPPPDAEAGVSARARVPVWLSQVNTHSSTFPTLRGPSAGILCCARFARQWYGVLRLPHVRR